MNKVLVLLTLCTTLLTGCNSKEVSLDFNSDYIIQEYRNNSTIAESNEMNFREYLFCKTDDLVGVDEYIGSNYTKEQLLDVLNNLRNDTNLMILESLEDDVASNDINFDKLNKDCKVYYFMDKESGAVEQYIIFYNMSTIHKISIKWIGGVIYDSEIDVLR